MKTFNQKELDYLALGAMLLGSGGGGDPSYNLLMAKQVFEDYAPAQLASLEEIEDDACVVPIAFMGAPLVGSERIPNGIEFEVILQALGKPADYLVAVEIGGGNAFTPIIAGARLGIPIVDGDSLGRAFPELQMSSCNLKRIKPGPALICGPLGNSMIMEAANATELEICCRKACVLMGSSCLVALYVMSGKEAKEALIPGTVSQAIALGKALGESIHQLLLISGGREIASGMIVDVVQEIQDGFLKGLFRLYSEGSSVQVHYQNEYLAAYVNGKLTACTPDLLILLEEETGKPITSEALQYGIRAKLLQLPAPALWKTAEGLKLVGPDYFKIRSSL